MQQRGGSVQQRGVSVQQRSGSVQQSVQLHGGVSELSAIADLWANGADGAVPVVLLSDDHCLRRSGDEGCQEEVLSHGWVQASLAGLQRESPGAIVLPVRLAAELSQDELLSHVQGALRRGV